MQALEAIHLLSIPLLIGHKLIEESQWNMESLKLVILAAASSSEVGLTLLMIWSAFWSWLDTLFYGWAEALQKISSCLSKTLMVALSLLSFVL